VTKRRKQRKIRLPTQKPKHADNITNPPDQKEAGPSHPNYEPAPSGGEIHQPKARTKTCKAKDTDKHWLDYATGIFAFIAAIGAVAAAIFASDTERRSLRAYVLANKAQIENFGIDRLISGTVELKNSGLTPSYRTRTYINIDAVSFPRTVQFPKIKVGTAEIIISPGGEPELTAKLEKLLSKEQIDKITAGDGAIYLFGATTYFDAFSTLHCTRFRFLVSGKLTPIEGAALKMGGTEGGNDADNNCEELW
jgi:hypothetical protein